MFTDTGGNSKCLSNPAYEDGPEQEPHAATRVIHRLQNATGEQADSEREDLLWSSADLYRGGRQTEHGP